MRTIPQAVVKLINIFDQLPGIGPKTAARLVFYLLHLPQDKLASFGQAMSNLKKNTKICSICYNVAETDPCAICNDTARDRKLICVIEQPLNILIFEKTGKFAGLYHVLHGAISPLNNIGPEDIYIPQLISRLDKNQVSELILATSPTMEGEATAMYIKDKLKDLGIKITRLAHGLPVGADIEYADEITLGKALEGRREY